MSKKSITLIMENIKKVLEQEKELSIRKISIKTGSKWASVNRALNSMKNLGLVKERKDNKDKRKSRLFSLIEK
jgi:predicted transcriptional regulator